MSAHTRWLLLFLVITVLIEVGLVWAVGLGRDYSGDEAHFVQTINHFGQGVDLERIAHYEEMSTPLPFILFASWGRVFGFEIESLRICSIIIALVAYTIYFHFLLLVLKRSRATILAMGMVVLNPYMIYLSLFVHTDILAMLFVFLCLIAMNNQRPILLGLALCGGVLCRQYLLFLVAGVLVYELLWLWCKPSRKHVAMLVSCVVSLVPFAGLVWLWGGLSPNNELGELYEEGRYIFHVESLVLYIAVAFIYLLPVLVVSWRKVYDSKKVVLAGICMFWVYLLFPVYPSASAQAIGMPTVGLFHRALRWCFANQTVEQAVFMIAFILGLPIVMRLLIDLLQRVRRKCLDQAAFWDIAALMFLLVMPLSYLHWEKYLLPVYPILIVRLLLFNNVSGVGGGLGLKHATTGVQDQAVGRLTDK